ncbi:glycosyltransferase [Candidatus Thorarchaeota archaeon]|nr:MAG: glycosyltransferase [Candidatus Thorarchaeota archaeon]
MVDSPLISVITPIHTTDHKLPQIRKALSSATEPIQLIIVLNNPNLVKLIKPQNSNEQVVVAPRKGRGFAFLEGIAHITGDITLLLHSDTIPPLGWEQAIITALKNPQVVGGGFSMTYDTPNLHLDIGVWVLNQWFRISGELYGDRAMFIRSHILRHCQSVLEVPLFEDLRLARCMHNYGRVVLLKDKVETSAVSFRKYGLLRYFGSFLLCRVWYATGGSPFQIYNAYYSTSKKLEN